jgi:transglutaminase-like putative cysteine protease
MKNLIFAIVCVLFYNTSDAQRYEFGRVSDEEIKQTAHHLDPEADAAILYKKGKVTMQYDNGWQYVYDFEARVKIYNQEGYDYATISVPLYRVGAGRNEIFSNFRGFTHNMESGKSVRERVRNSDIFDEDVNEFWDLKKITFPNVQAGSVLEYTYKIVSPYPHSLPEFDFQDQIPVDYAEYSMEIPEWLGYKTYSKGFLPLSRTSNTSLSEFSYSYVPSQTSGTSAHGSHRTFHNTVTINKTTTTYSVKDAPKVVQEEYMNNFSNYISTIKPELEWSRMPGSQLQTFSTTWDDIAKRIYESRRFGEELNSKNYFEGELNAVLNNTTTSTERVLAIFEYVKNRMTWNGMNGYHAQSGLRKAFTEKTGNVGDINLMMVAMMRHAKLDAHPVLVSTKSNGIPLFPTRTGFNYVVCAVNINNQMMLLDATNKFSAPNVLPERTLNWFGRLIKDENQNQQVGLMPGNPSRRIVNMDVNVLPNAVIEGKYRVSLTDYHALRYRINHGTKSESVYLEELEKRLGDTEISEYSIQNKTDVYKPVIESYNFSKENAFDVISGKLYISPLFFETNLRNPFTAETRAYPIDFGFGQSQAYMITINIPEGYKIESIPESVVYQLPDEIGEFRYMISNTENTIQLRVTYDIKTALIPPDYYEALKNYYGATVSKEAEKIILSKI